MRARLLTFCGLEPWAERDGRAAVFLLFDAHDNPVVAVSFQDVADVGGLVAESELGPSREAYGDEA